MGSYVARRLLLFVPTLLGSSIIVFALLRIIPGDVALLILGGGEGAAVDPQELHQLRVELGLDHPLYVQYFDWIKGMVTLDMGTSLWTGEPVTKEIASRFPVTLQLAIIGVIVSTTIAIPLGLLSAMFQDSWLDHGVRFVTVAGMSLPNFWFATLIILALVLVFNWLPPIGSVPLFWENPAGSIPRLMLPAIALGWRVSAMTTRMVRSSTLEVLRQDYIRTGRAKGLREAVLMRRHALKNAMLPVITIIGVQASVLLGGSVIIESIFILPGIGGALIDSVFLRDWPLTQAIVMLMVAVALVLNLAVDLSYALLDPRIRYT